MKRERSEPTRVLVFPTSSEPGLEIVRALVDQPGLEIVGGSSLPSARDPSSRILRHHVTLPWLGSGEFPEALARVLRDFRIRVVFPATDGLIAGLSRADLGGAALVAPRPEVAEICLSKRKTYERLKGVVPVPRVYEGDGEVELPAYAKPLEEAGMRGHLPVNDPEDLRIARKRGLLVTAFLPGEEYEVNCLSDLQGVLLYAGIRRLGRRVGGHILDSQSVEDAQMKTYVESIAAEMRIEGPWFAQFKRDREDRPVLIEVNARIGGGSGLNRYGGVNLPLLAVRLFTGRSIRRPVAAGPVAVSRSLQFFVHTEAIERVVWESSALTRTDGKANPRVMACLFDLWNRGVRQYLLHPAGSDVRGFMEEAKIPCFFDRIVGWDEERQGSWLEALRGLCAEPCRKIVFVTGGTGPSPQEVCGHLPGMPVATPDTLEMLGSELLS